MKNNGPIRILQYIGSLNVGGSQTMIMEIYRKIDKSKIQFDFIIDHDNELFFSEEIINMGGKIYTLKNINEVNFFEFKKQWQNFFISHKEYKIIHCHVRSVASIVLKIAKKNGVKTICHSHSTSNGRGIKSIIKRIFQKNICKNADFLFACSEDSGKWLYGDYWDLKKKNCFLVNNAIDSSKYSFDCQIRKEIIEKYNFDNKIIIGQVGRLIDLKNHLFSLEIIKKLVEYNNRYILLIIGDGPNRELINDKIIEYKLEKNVFLLGNKNNVNEFMQAMDIFIMPSKYEGLPLALVEAQASSLPCIVSKNITAGFLIDELIYKLSLENIDEWVDVITSISNVKRINRKKRIIESGFDIKENVILLENFYIKIFNDKRCM